MEKRKCLTFLFCLILCYSLFQHTATAQSSSGASILSQGSITYPSSNVNLAVIPDDWGLTYGSGPQIISVDYSVEHTSGNPSITIAPHTSADANTNRECDGTWYNVVPGDVIEASVWILVDSVTPYTNQYNGGRLGMDFYAHTSAGYGIVYSLPTNANNGISTVTFGTVGWMQVSWNVIVPSTQYTTILSNGQTCSPVQIDSFVCWLDVRPSSGSTSVQGQVWFADAQLYINPT